MSERCGWSTGSQLYLEYHDVEWGVPVHDERKLFEMLILEGAQAGLSWSTILNKRQNYLAAFANFEPERVASYDEHNHAELMANAGIVRNRLKITAAIENARAFLEIQRQYGSFDKYIWQFVDGQPLQNSWSSLERPAREYSALRYHEQSVAQGRFSFCRQHHLLFLYASGGYGQRSHHHLFSLGGSASTCRVKYESALIFRDPLQLLLPVFAVNVAAALAPAVASLPTAGARAAATFTSSCLRQ